MRFGSLSARGYSLMAVCGSRFDPSILPSRPDLPVQADPAKARAAIRAVQRARVVSYIERGILPQNALRDPSQHEVPRDEHCIHLIIHRRNCLLGAIRLQFHRKSLRRDDPQPFYSEIFTRNTVPISATKSVNEHLEQFCETSRVYLETSGWLVNPDLTQRAIIAISLPSAVWAAACPLADFAGISTLRASNGAAKTLRQLGGTPVRHDDQDLVIEDSYYRGAVQLMVMHSRRYHPEIDSLVQECFTMLTHTGLTVFHSF
ncbi:MAG: hypothetical protein V4675_16930 [Verrucomicrobiota bacterium]